MTNQRWLRPRIATPSPPLTPIAIIALAAALAAASSSLKVRVPSSSMTATRCGVRRALTDGIIPISPQRAMSAAIALTIFGDSSLSAPDSNIFRT